MNSTWYPTNALDATAFSLVYGLPLLSWLGVAVPLLTVVGTNAVYSQHELLNATFTAVVSPNEDTLYQDILVDLSRNDLVITAPNVTDDRFWALSFSDPYGNNFANIGSVTRSPPGRYLVRRADAEPSVQMCNSTSEFRGIINAPTTYSLLDGRIYVKANTSQDLQVVHGYQRELTATLLNRTASPDVGTYAPELSLGLLAVNGTFHSAAERNLELLARLAPYNQPVVQSDRWRVASVLGASGIYGGHYHPQPTVSVTDAQHRANSTIKSASLDSSSYVNFGGGWYADALEIAGDFGTDYAYRAFSATEFYPELVPSQALYPRSRLYYNMGFALPAGQSLLFTFSDIPPVNTDGFWSLTVYSEKFALVPNALGRYEIGTRQNLTYEDGTPDVRDATGNGSSDATRPFQVLLQAADEVPPSNWSANWLPTMAGGGGLNFNLRFYDPTPALTNDKVEQTIVDEKQGGDHTKQGYNVDRMEGAATEQLNARPSDDPKDPLNWPLGLKIACLLQASLLGALGGLNTAIINPAYIPMANELGITTVHASYQTTIVIALKGLGPFIWLPLANVYGCRPMYLFCTLLGFGTALGSA
ncbi:hypothetical protein LTR85_008547 [Meristemomyces frigidus]|nr:hypothetical protein LTR85_008547 [Meristemomyces frigidus]